MRVSLGVFVLSVALTGCDDGRKAQTELTGKTYSAIHDGRGEEAVQLAHLLVDSQTEYPDYGALGRAYVVLAEDRWAAGDRAGASAALRDAVAFARKGNSSDLLRTQVQAQPLRVRMREWDDAVAAGREIGAILGSDPYLYDEQYFEGVAAIALAYLEVGEGAEAQAMAWRVYDGYWSHWRRKQEDHRKLQAEGADPLPLIPRSWRGLPTVGRVLLETGAADEGVEIWGQNFTINAYYTPESLLSDVQEAAAAFRKAGRQTPAADLERHAEPLRLALARSPYPQQEFDPDGDLTAQILSSNREWHTWSEQVLAVLPADNPLRAPYRTMIDYYSASIAHSLDHQQRMAAAEEAAAEREWQEAINLLGSVGQYLPALGAASYGLATDNTQAMSIAQQQFQALADAEAAQTRSSAAASQIASDQSQADTIQMCMQAKGPQCLAAEARAAAWHSSKINATATALPDGKGLPEVVRPLVVSYCSNKIAADVARTCAAEMSGQAGLAACVKMADDVADQHEGLAVDAVRAAASYSAQQDAVKVTGQGGVLDSAEACYAWQ